MSQNLTLGITSIATTFITTEIMGRHLMHRESGRHRQKRKIKPEGEPEGLPKFKKQIAIVSTVGPRRVRLALPWKTGEKKAGCKLSSNPFLSRVGNPRFS
jgi:hypothetical protein